jgi:hypothetical protein
MTQIGSLQESADSVTRERADAPVDTAAERTTCRACGEPLQRSFLDLGTTPLANAYLSDADLAQAEPKFRLHVKLCEHCLLAQL